MGFDFYAWIVLPLLICLARITDVSLGTLRFVFVSKGMRNVAPILGFFEILVWLVAAREVMMNLKNIACFLAYCVGFALGNYVGLWIEEKLSLGVMLVRIIVASSPEPLIAYMKENDYGVTIVEGEGGREKVKIIFTIIQRKTMNKLIHAIVTHTPNAFYSIENVKSVSAGIFPTDGQSVIGRLFSMQRKGK